MILKYFSPKEFKCDGVECFNKMDEELLAMLDIARETAGIPFKINSSWRSEEYNKELAKRGYKVAKNSPHLRGYAVDIHCTNSSDRYIIIDALINVGFKRLGIAKTFIHVDNDPSLPDLVTWLY